MGPKKDPAWDHTTAVTENVLKDSGLSVVRSGWKCKHCDKPFWNSDIK